MEIENSANKTFKREEVKQLLKPKNDIVFQTLFSKEHVNITKNFVQSLLDKKIKSIKINDDKELFRENISDKLGILDLQLDIDNKEKVDVEIQLIDKGNFIERLMFYFSRLYSNTIRIGEDYIKAKRVVLIAILDYDLEITKFTKEMQTQWMLRETKNREKILTDKIEVDIIELSKVKAEYRKNKNNKKAQWMLFLDDPNSKEVQEIMKENKEIEEAIVTVHKMTEDEKIERLAWLREKAILDEKSIRSTYLKRGREEGKEKSIKEMVKNMKKENISIETIIKVTGLSKEEIEKL